MSENKDGNHARDIRLGYLIAESASGLGLATEVVAGVAEWCREDGTVRSIIGGVDDRNGASAPVLHKYILTFSE
jgi:RimJ/RimL family protein N-acetyltransferase